MSNMDELVCCRCVWGDWEDVYCGVCVCVWVCVLCVACVVCVCVERERDLSELLLC